MSSLTDELKNARGKRYYDILKEIMYGDIGAAMLEDFDQVVKATGHFQLADLARIAMRYDVNLKATCEWLEEKRRLGTGTYDRLKDRGLKVKKLYADVLAMDALDNTTEEGGGE